jgi:transposase-like protein
MQQKRYTAEHKRWVISQMAPPLNRSVVELAKETGITGVTLRTWRKEAMAAGELSPIGDGGNWSSAQKFQAVLETAPLSAEEVSEYCRRKGIQPEQLRQWRAACEQANGTDVAAAAAGTPVANPSALKRLKELERQLQRKDAALAEAAALLMLRKKANAIWGTEEDE